MTKNNQKRQPANLDLAKCATGFRGLDEITNGGLPQGRPTLICGGAGCGKTLLAMEFLVRGATQYHEPGVFIAFEETAEELTQNVASLGFDLNSLSARKQIIVDCVQLDHSQIEETGAYSLEGLFIRLGSAIDTIGAKRVVIDTIDALFAGFANTAILRSELHRLLRWLKDKGVTTVVTAERGEGTLTRHGLEEHVSDCVILLDHRVINQRAIRRLRIVKYRGSAHNANEFPFLINEHGFSVVPITSVGLNYVASTDFISSGIVQLDALLGGQGYYRGASILISGTAGTGKTSVAAHFVDATCRRGERCLYFAFEEATGQIMRNMRSIGLDLQTWVSQGSLHFQASRPTEHSLEMHLAMMVKTIDEFKPDVVILDSITNFQAVGTLAEVNAMMMRLLDFLKMDQITALFTSLTSAGSPAEQSDADVSSLIDTWLLLRNSELYGEYNRALYVLKSRGMAHSNQIREFVFTDHGVELVKPYLGVGGVLTGSARVAQEAHDRAEILARKQEIERIQYSLERMHKTLDAKIAVLQAEFAAEVKELEAIITIRQEELQKQDLLADSMEISRRRGMGVSRHSNVNLMKGNGSEENSEINLTEAKN